MGGRHFSKKVFFFPDAWCFQWFHPLTTRGVGYSQNPMVKTMVKMSFFFPNGHNFTLSKVLHILGPNYIQYQPWMGQPFQTFRSWLNGDDGDDGDDWGWAMLLLLESPLAQRRIGTGCVWKRLARPIFWPFDGETIANRSTIGFWGTICIHMGAVRKSRSQIYDWCVYFALRDC